VSTLWAEGRRWQPAMEQAERDRLYAGWKKAVERSLGWA
jgi:glycerol kinase